MKQWMIAPEGVPGQKGVPTPANSVEASGLPQAVQSAYEGDLVRAEAMGLPRQMASILAMVGHADPFMRRDGMEQLSRTPEALEMLSALIKAPSVQARRAAALCTIGFKGDAVAVLRQLLRDESPAVRYDVALAASRRSDGRDILLSLQYDQAESVAEHCKRALKETR